MSFANLSEREIVFNMVRLTWPELGGALASLADLMCRGTIPVEQREEYQDHAAALHAAGNSLLFLSERFNDIDARVREETRAWNQPVVGEETDEVVTAIDQS